MTRSLAIALASLALAPASAAAAWTPEDVPSSDALEITSFAFTGAGQGLLAYEGFSDHRFTRLVLRDGSSGWLDRGELNQVSWADVAIRPFGGGDVLYVAARPFATGRLNRARLELVAALGTSAGPGAWRRLDRDGSGAVAATNERGGAVVGWVRRGVVRVARRVPRQGFARIQSLSRRGARLPAVGINRRGDIVAAWVRRGRIEARYRRAGRGWSRVTRIVRPPLPAASVHAAVAADGRALVGWGALSAPRREGGEYRVAHGVALRARGRWHRATLERFARRRYDGTPQLLPRFDGRGRALLAWAGENAGAAVIKVATITPERGTLIGRFAAPAGRPVDDFEVSGRGALALSWSGDGGTGPFVTHARDGRAFAAPTDLHVGGTTSLAGSSLAFRGEQPVVAWVATSPGATPRVHAAADAP